MNETTLDLAARNAVRRVALKTTRPARGAKDNYCTGNVKHSFILVKRQWGVAGFASLPLPAARASTTRLALANGTNSRISNAIVPAGG